MTDWLMRFVQSAFDYVTQAGLDACEPPSDSSGGVSKKGKTPMTLKHRMLAAAAGVAVLAFVTIAY